MNKNSAPPPAESQGSEPRRRGGGSRAVFETIRDEILELRLAPGSALDESSLAKRFEMSRSPIREALVRLSAEGLVHTLENRSTIVAPLDLATVPRFVEALDYVQRIVTRLAAVHRTPDDIERMYAAAEAYDRTCLEGHPLVMSAANKDFHLCIAEAGGNPYFTEMYSKLLDEGRRILHMHYAHRRYSDNPNPLNPAHFRMVDAVRDQDEKRADQLAHEHSGLFHDRLIEFMRVNYLEDVAAP